DNLKIVLYEIVNPWSWDEFDVAFQESLEMVETIDYPVDAIIDVRTGKKLPAGILTQGTKITSKFRQDKGTRIAVFVGAPEFLKMIVRTFNRIHKQVIVRVFFAETYNEATQIIADYRAGT
ncbi:MAG: hypothetical protein ACPG7F_19675, partial [Aggregatilineales bacterium]